MQEHVTCRSDFRLEHSEELEGLRALAVASVFLYHLDSRLLPSGFTGVDVFFVLSGFLIGRKLLAEFDETGRIRLFAFTAARAKRLLPNAALVLLVVATATWLFLPPYRFTDIASDLTASGLFFSNFHFATEAVDYLRIGAPPSPVLHFWSLSIEEQFYLGLPALMLAVGLVLRRRQIEFVIGLVALIAVASFALGWSDLQSSQPAAFFETQSRIWQLAVGVLTGWSVARLGAFLDRPLSLCLAFAACTGLAWSTTMLVGAYPGPNALFPTLSTAVLLFAMFCGLRTRLHQALASPVSRWIGNRSYSDLPLALADDRHRRRSMARGYQCGRGCRAAVRNRGASRVRSSRTAPPLYEGATELGAPSYSRRRFSRRRSSYLSSYCSPAADCRGAVG